MNKIILFALQFFLFVQLAFSAERYVFSATGNDTTGDGSYATPWQTIQKCVDNSTGGDTCFLVGNFSANNVTWNTGFGTSSGLSPFKVIGYDDGQENNVTTASCYKTGACVAGAVIDSTGFTSPFTTGSTFPDAVTFQNIKFTGFTGYFRIRSNFNLIDCQMASVTGYLGSEYGGGNWINNYLVIERSTAGQGVFLLSNDRLLNNVIDVPKGISLNGAGNVLIENVIKTTNSTFIFYVQNNAQYFYKNTIIGSGEETQSVFNTGSHLITGFLKNRIINVRDFSIGGNVIFNALGNNALYNSTYDTTNTAFSVPLDLRARDVTDSTLPIVSLTDYSLKLDAETLNAGNLNIEDSVDDIGAVQSESTVGSGGGGGSIIFTQ